MTTGRPNKTFTYITTEGLMLGHPVVNSLWRGTTKLVSLKSTRDVEEKMYNIFT